jgi:hypothetical protein
VPLHKFGDIELWLFQDLDLANKAILDGKDGRGRLGNIVSNGSRDEFLDETLEISLGSQFGHDSRHFGANGTNLCGFGIASRLDLVVLGACKGDAKQSDNVTVGSSAIDIGLNDGLLFANETAELVSGHVHSMEIQEAIVALNVLDAKLDFTVGHGFILVEVRQGDFDDASLEVVRSDLGSLGLGNQGLSTVLGGEDGRCNQFVPFLFREGVDCLFAASLLGFRQSLVLTLLMDNGKRGRRSL